MLLTWYRQINNGNISQLLKDNNKMRESRELQKERDRVRRQGRRLHTSCIRSIQKRIQRNTFKFYSIDYNQLNVKYQKIIGFV